MSGQNPGAASLADWLIEHEPWWAIPSGLLLFFIPGFYPNLDFLGWVGLAVIIFSWGLRRWRWGYFSRRTVFDGPLILFLISALLGIWVSNLPEVSESRFWVLLGGIFLFNVGSNHSSEKYLRFYVILIALVGLGGIVVIGAQFPGLEEYPSFLREIPILSSLIEWFTKIPNLIVGNSLTWSLSRNGIASASMAVFPFTWPLARLSKKKSIRFLAAGLAILLAASLLISGGIGALIGLTLGWVIVWLMQGKLLASLGVLGASLSAFIGLLIFWPANPMFLYLLYNLNIRLDLWQSAIFMIKDFPLSGVGLGLENWFALLPKYALPNLAIYYDQPGENILLHAHNFYLQTWIEQGLLGFISLIAIFVLGLWWGRDLMKKLDGFRRDIVFGSVWSLAALAVYSLGYSGLSTQGSVMLFGVLGVIVAAGSKASPYAGQFFLNLSKVEWFGLTVLLSLVCVGIIGRTPQLGIMSAVGAGLTLACGNRGVPKTK